MRAAALLAILALAACDSDPADTCGDGGCFEGGVDAGVDLPLKPDQAVDAAPPDASPPDAYTGDLVFFGDSQVAGWPQKMTPGISGKYLLSPFYGVALVDIDGKAGLEIVASSGDRVYAFSAAGATVPGWPASLANGTAQAPPSVGDVDGDGKPEIVQIARGLKYSDTSYIHVIDHLGKEQAGWPKSFPNLIFQAPSLADLDGDGAMEIIVQVSQWPPAGTIHVLEGDGTAHGTGWKHTMDSYGLAPAAVGDLDGDKKLDVGYLTTGKVTVRSADGMMRTGFPIAAATGYVNAGSLVFADLDPSTTDLELIWADKENTSSTATARLWAADAKGKALAGFPVTLNTQSIGVLPVAVVDVDGDGKLEAVATVKPGHISVVSSAGKVVGTQITTAKQLHADARAVDVTGDGNLEFLSDNNTGDKFGIGYLDGYLATGASIPGFPLRPFGSTMADSGTLADLDGNGTLELVVVTTSTMVSPVTSWVSIWRLTSSKQAKGHWPAYGYDARRSNCPGCASASAP